MLLLFLLAIRSEGKINFYQRRFFYIFMFAFEMNQYIYILGDKL